MATKIRYAMLERVEWVKEKFKRKYTSGVGTKAKFEDISIGWYIKLEGASESYFLSETEPLDDNEEPLFNPGDRVKITLEKEDV